MSHCVSVALGGEVVCRLAADHRRPPFDHLEEGAEREAGAHHERRQPATASQRGPAYQDLPHQDCGHEALDEMADPVPGVARQSKNSRSQSPSGVRAYV
jgi:hypothetical protein